MRRIRVLLLFAFFVTSCLYGWIQIQNRISGKTFGPEISCPEGILEVSVYQDQSAYLTGVQASDKQDGDLTSQVMVAGVSKLISEDTAKVTYIVFDKDENMASCERTVRYLDYQRPRIYADEALSYSSISTTTLGKGLRGEDAVDGDITDLIRVSTLTSTEESDVFRVVAQVTNSMGDTRRVELPVIIQSDEVDQPVINLKEYILYLEEGDTFVAKDHIRNVTAYRQTFSTADVEIEGSVDTSEPGTYWVKYQFVHDGKVSKAILTVVVQ